MQMVVIFFLPTDNQYFFSDESEGGFLTLVDSLYPSIFECHQTKILIVYLGFGCSGLYVQDPEVPAVKEELFF